MSFKKITYSAVLLLIIVLFCQSCGATTAKTVKEEEKRPVWIDNYPVDSAYFVGIGSSKSGDKNADLDAAKAKALTSLASAISVSIKSSQEFTVRENSSGKSSQTAEIQITQSVNSNFKDVEVFDSYYSDDSGYWFYYRISKARWAEIERQAKADIASRVSDIVSPQLSATSATDFEILSALGKGWLLVAESPYEGDIKTQLNGENGILIDMLENNVSKVFSRLTLQIEPETVITEPGKLETIKVKVTDREGRVPGQFKIDICSKADNKKITEITTDKEGNYSGKLGFPGLPVGKNGLYASLSMPYLGITPEGFRKTVSPPQKDFAVTVNQISVILKLVINGDADIESLPDSVRALFSRKELALRLSPGGSGEKHTILFTMFFRNMPENAHGLFITNAKATISLLNEGSNIYSYETKEYKEVGLDWDQAQERAAIKMFKDINNDSVFIHEFYNAVYAGLSLD